MAAGEGEPLSSERPQDIGAAELILQAHELMRQYAEDRLASPLAEGEVSAVYLDRYISLVARFQGLVSDQAALTDALTLVRCFAAYPLLPANRTGPGCVVQVLDWVVHADPGWEPAQTMAAISSGINSATFWKYLSDSVATGRFSDAVAALEQAFESEDEPLLEELAALLSSYPLDTDSEFVWRQWHKEAINLHSQVEGLTSQYQPFIERVTAALRGSQEAAVELASSWYAAVGAQYLFVDPSPDMLPTHFLHARNAFPPDLTLDWEEGCVNVFEDRILIALARLQRLDLGASVVMAEFCHQRGLLHQYVGNGIREQLALKFAEHCLNNNALVGVGIELLANMATPEAKQCAANLLPQLVARDRTHDEAAQALALQLDIPDVAAEVSRTSAQRDASEGHWVTAVAAYYAAGDFLACREVAWRFFETVILERSLATTDSESSYIVRGLPADSERLSPAVLDCLAPVGVLVGLLDGTSPGTTALTDVEEPLAALLSFPQPPVRAWPLLVALVISLGSEFLVVGPRATVLLLTALDRWDESDAATKEESAVLLRDALTRDIWQPLLQPEYDINDTVWLLRRRLATDVF